MIAEIIVNYKSKKVDKLFDYAIPEELLSMVVLGSCVTVPFGRANKPKEGYVFSIKEKSSAKNLKSILNLSRKDKIIDEKQKELIKWMRDKYLVTYLDAVRAIAPSGAGINHEEWIELISHDVKGSTAKEIVRILSENGGAMEINRLMGHFEANISSSISLLQKNGKVQTVFKECQAAGDKVIRVAELAMDAESIFHTLESLEKSNAPVQAKMLDILTECGRLSLADLVHFSGGSYNALKALEKKGYIKTYEMTVLREIGANSTKPEKPKKLTDEQEKVLSPLCNAAKNGKYKKYLLHGVTGSGKTEVYMQLISEVVKNGRQAIMLVPEISLTPQTVARFRARFSDDIAIIHSGLSLGERYDQWKKIREGKANIVVGARSAVFAPFCDIGAIIIDEEHERSYKSEMSPRYETHEVAEFRAKQYGAVLLLASATPLVTSYYKAQNGKTQLLTMEKRFNNNRMPKVEIVDLRHELEKGNRSILSESLVSAISENLNNKKQTILFLNRRGYSTFVSCRSCGFVAECPNCSISLTYHKFSDTLKCHYCGYTVSNYKTCPECGSKYIRYFGGGTQKVEEEIHRFFPNATTIRMDIDTTSRKNAHESILKKFGEENIDILIGTQMVTKGLDFPNVTLVGVISADTMLNIDDYRAKERTFSILEQVTGRAGRADLEGKSIVQTYSPENSAIKLMQRHDYKQFYEDEIAVRRAMWYPPFCEMVAVIFSGKNESVTNRCAKFFVKNIADIGNQPQKSQILGPISAYISKIKNKYIFRILIKCENSDMITGILAGAKSLCEENPIYENVSVIIDKNPNMG
ncbi:MAG: primosomal protein N' [Firmicutes bacterium]|nr:primosomal protein N' [Bacillota bacterium]